MHDLEKAQDGNLHQRLQAALADADRYKAEADAVREGLSHRPMHGAPRPLRAVGALRGQRGDAGVFRQTAAVAREEVAAAPEARRGRLGGGATFVTCCSLYPGSVFAPSISLNASSVRPAEAKKALAEMRL